MPIAFLMGMRNMNATPCGRATLAAASLALAALVACQDPEAESSDVTPASPDCSEGVQARVAFRAASASVGVRYLARSSGAVTAGAEDPLRRLGIVVLDPDARAAAGEESYEFVEEDGLAETAAYVSDPRIIEQWHLSAVQAPQAWSSLAGLNGPPIAVVDSGIFSFHPDLAGRVLPGWNLLTGTADTTDLQGHGTSVSGVAAAIRGNSLGIAGVAPSAVVPIVAADSGGRAWYSDIARGIIYAADRGIRVINVSLGGESPSQTLQAAVDYAWSRGCLVVASAMNHGSDAPRYPAACDKVLAVGALDPSHAVASFSGRGPWVDLMAPGVSILTTVGGRCYGARHGTSFAAPLTSAVAALALTVRPDLNVEQLADVLVRSCDDLGAPGTDDLYGAGRVNAMKAVDLATTIGVDAE